jgi:hypothetical protein
MLEFAVGLLLGIVMGAALGLAGWMIRHFAAQTPVCPQVKAPEDEQEQRRRMAEARRAAQWEALMDYNGSGGHEQEL